MKKINFRSSKAIQILFMVLFIVVAIILLVSTLFIKGTIEYEEKIQDKRAYYKQLGQNLGDASDYLTKEVRLYSITGNIIYFYNYWNEYYVTQRRENAITEFEAENPPKEELIKLESAKKNSDDLMQIEMSAMKLMILSDADNIDEKISEAKALLITSEEKDELDNYIRIVMNDAKDVEIEKDKSLQEQSINMLYDDNYESYKTLIMGDISDFTVMMNQRLTNEFEQSHNKTQFAEGILILLSLISIGSIAIILIIINKMFINPIQSYTKVLIKSDKAKNFHQSSDQTLKMQFEPQGSLEMIELGNAFNSISKQLINELQLKEIAEVNMQKAVDEAIKANSAKSMFLAQMSHELRTPLNAVNGYDILLNKTDLTEKQREYVKNINLASDGLLNLINKILDFSKIESGMVELEDNNFSIKKLSSEVISILLPQAERKNIYLKLEIENNINDNVSGDSERLRQILINLISNAIKFTQTGGVRLKLSKGKQDKQVRFDVIDTGIGIEKEKIKKIFKPFVQADVSTSRKYGGTGLGLSISNQLINLMSNGTQRLKVESKVNKGSDFYFSIIFEASKEISEEIETADYGNIEFKSKKVLIVDDNEINITVQSEILKGLGFETYSALSGGEALNILNAIKDIDLIFLDIRMPVMDGYETSKNIRCLNDYKNTPIIALTADALSEVKAKIKSYNIDDYLLKPIKENNLLNILNKYLGYKVAKSSNSPSNSMSLVNDNNLDGSVLFDKEKCLSKLNNNEDYLFHVLELFLNEHGKDIDEVKSALDINDFEKAENIIHRLKGVSGSICCNSLYIMCDKYKKLFKLGKTDNIDELYELWDKTLKRIKLEYGKLNK